MYFGICPFVFVFCIIGIWRNFSVLWLLFSMVGIISVHEY